MITEIFKKIQESKTLNMEERSYVEDLLIASLISDRDFEKLL